MSVWAPKQSFVNFLDKRLLADGSVLRLTRFLSFLSASVQTKQLRRRLLAPAVHRYIEEFHG